MGNFRAASVIAFSASAGGRPSNSKRTRPGLTTATQNSGAPLPFPMRVSAGFLEIGLSGKRRTQTFPPFLTKRVNATRDASIWRLVIQCDSSACRPYCPKSTVVADLALPLRRPRCALRYLTRFGINISDGLLGNFFLDIGLTGGDGCWLFLG